MAAALLVTLPATAFADQEGTDAPPADARTVAAAAVLPGPAYVRPARPFLQQPARVAAVAPARQALGGPPDPRQVRPASRSMNRRAAVRQVRKVRNVSRLHTLRVAGRRVERGLARRAPAARSGIARAIAFARSQVGDRYVHGGTGDGGWDCSGLMQAAYAKAGIRLPHSSHDQGQRGTAVAASARRPGDLMVWPGHVAIYVGNGQMIDAGNQRVGVVKRGIWGRPRYRRL